MWSEEVTVSCSVMSDSLLPHGLYPARLLCPCSPGKNTGVGCHSLLQRLFSTQRSNPCLLHYRQILQHLSDKESLLGYVATCNFKFFICFLICKTYLCLKYINCVILHIYNGHHTDRQTVGPEYYQLLLPTLLKCKYYFREQVIQPNCWFKVHILNIHLMLLGKLLSHCASIS